MRHHFPGEVKRLERQLKSFFRQIVEVLKRLDVEVDEKFNDVKSLSNWLSLLGFVSSGFGWKIWQLLSCLIRK